jgi:hypothetical protein
VREATDIVREYPKLDEEDVPGNEIWRLALHRTDAAIECIFRGPPGHLPRWG